MSRRTTPSARTITTALILLALLLSFLPMLRADSTDESVTPAKAKLPVPLYETSAAYDGSRYAYVFGGLNAATSAMNTIVQYDSQTDTITTMPTAMQTPRDSTAAVWDPRSTATCPSGCGYVIGGFFENKNLDTILVYNPATQTALDSSVKLPCGMAEPSSVFDGKYAYIFAAEPDSLSCQAEHVMRFDPIQGQLVIMNAHFPQLTAWASAIWDPRHTSACAQGCAYIFGGSHAGSPPTDVDTIYRYNPATDTLTTMVSRLPTSRFWTTAAFDGTRAYVFGGSNASTNQFLNDIIWFDPIADSVGKSSLTLLLKLDSASGVWAGNHGYVFGGVGCDASNSCLVQKDIVQYQAPSTPPPSTSPPVASFQVSTRGFSASVDASGSTAPSGTIMSYAWDWGDGATSAGVTSTRTYASAGTYTIRLAVTDNQGTIGTTTHSVTVSAPNQPPIASFTTSTSGLTVNADASASTDSDGSITNYAWTWGDSSSVGSGRTATHTYAAGGTYTITLTVADNGGATASTTRSTTVNAPPPPQNQPPTASFTTSTSGLTASTDATASTDSDGTIANYAWSWDDGATSAGVTSTHTYARAGMYTVRLTVTDNMGATGTMTQSVSATAPPSLPPAPMAYGPGASTEASAPEISASQTFSWGPVSGASTYTLYMSKAPYGSANIIITRSGLTSTSLPLTKNDINAAGGGSTQFRWGVTASNTAGESPQSNVLYLRATPPAPPPAPVAVSPGSASDTSAPELGANATFSWQPVQGATSYNLYVSKAPYGSDNTVLTRSGLMSTSVSISASEIRTAGAGATNYQWSVTATNNTGEGPQSSALYFYTTPPPNQAPTGSFNATTDNLTIRVDASTSNDTEGTITNYTWNWGDNSPTTSGKTATHTYAASGNYSITLTITNDANQNASMTRSVNLTAPPPPARVTPPTPPTQETTSHQNESNDSAPLDSAASQDNESNSWPVPDIHTAKDETNVPANNSAATAPSNTSNATVLRDSSSQPRDSTGSATLPSGANASLLVQANEREAPAPSFLLALSAIALVAAYRRR